MNDLSVRIRRAAARWLFTELRMGYVGEEYGISGRCADVIGLSFAHEEVRGVYRKVAEEWGGRTWKTSRRVDEKRILHPPEVRIVEVKISRADFLAGVRKGQIGNAGSSDNPLAPSLGLGAFADFVYLAVPPAPTVLRADELPTGWGLLHIDVTVRVIAKPTRLAPQWPLASDPERLAKGLAQSALWRLYGLGRPDLAEIAS